MIKIKYSIRPYIKKNGQVAIRVRWNSKQYEVSFITGVYADPTKWDEDSHKAFRGTIHTIREMSYTASEINERISEFKQEIVYAFEKYSLQNSVPMQEDLKKLVNDRLGRTEDVKAETYVAKKKTMKQMIEWFLEERGKEKNWNDHAKEKYTQAFQHITKANPGIRPDKITVDHMYKLRDWYVKNEYKNRTINKQVTMLKGFLKWINTKDGYTVPNAVLNFETNLKVLPKTVTFLHYDELLHFAHYKFKNDISGRLSRARDYWCFMAFTSLRISDLLRLNNVHLFDDRIEMFAKKTGEHLYIPLTKEAQVIIDRYKVNDNTDNFAFNIPSAQKLNDAIKDAAREAGLDRIVTDVYMIGTKRREESHKFCDIIKNHDGRRTFVTCSLAMGIPAEVVMKCTGHKNYNTLKPYIETTTETLTLQMEKWDKNPYRSKIINLIDNVDEKFLKGVLSYIQRKQAREVKATIA